MDYVIVFFYLIWLIFLSWVPWWGWFFMAPIYSLALLMVVAFVFHKIGECYEQITKR